MRHRRGRSLKARTAEGSRAKTHAGGEVTRSMHELPPWSASSGALGPPFRGPGARDKQSRGVAAAS
eukprot:8435972-Alexandrium_andersonii.AAC.1